MHYDVRVDRCHTESRNVFFGVNLTTIFKICADQV